MAGRSGRREDQDQARCTHICVEQLLELTDGMQVRQMDSRWRGLMEEGRLDDQPGGQQNTGEREQAADLDSAWKTGKKACICVHLSIIVHHQFLLLYLFVNNGNVLT